MKPKKEIYVLQIITRLDLGGAQQACLLLVNGLRNCSIPVELIAGTGGELESNVNNMSGLVLLEELKYSISLLSDIRCLIKLTSKIRKLKKIYPHMIVHTHCPKAGIMGRWAAFFAGVKTRVHTIHGHTFHSHQNKLVATFYYLCELLTSLITTHFICVSAADVKKGINCFPRFYKKHSIIRAAINWKQFYQPHKSKYKFPSAGEPFIFGTIACLKKGKNLFELAQAFNYVHNHNPLTRLEIIGGGPLHSALKQWINKHNLSHAILLHGWKYPILSIIKKWHCFCFSSLWEGLPCSIIEARLQKLPVLSYRTGGIPEIIMHGQNGLLYQQHNWQGLANGMLKICQNPQIHKKLQSYKDKLDDFNDKQMVKQHIELYKKLL